MEGGQCLPGPTRKIMIELALVLIVGLLIAAWLEVSQRR